MVSWLSEYKEGCFIDSKDTMNTWCVGKIIEKDSENKTLKIRYEGWSDKWDNTFPFNSNRIAPFRTQSQLYTGQKGMALRTFVFSAEYLDDLVGKMLTLPDASFEITQFLRGELFTAVDCILVHEYKNNTELDKGIWFLAKILEFIVGWMNDSQKHFSVLRENSDFLSDKNTALAASWPELIFTLKRIFGLDLRTSKGLSTWNRIPEGYVFNGNTENRGRSVYYFVNFFYSIGGFQAISNILKEEE